MGVAMKTEKLEFRGGNYMSLLPFAVFIITTIALSFANFQDISMMVGAGDMMFTAFYSWVIWVITLICCFTGIGRTFEGRNGEEIKSKTRPQL